MNQSFRLLVFYCFLWAFLISCAFNVKSPRIEIQQSDLIYKKPEPRYCGTRIESHELEVELGAFQDYMTWKFKYYEPNRSFVILDSKDSFQSKMVDFSNLLKDLELHEILNRMKHSESFEQVPYGKLYWCNTWDYKTDSLSISEEFNLLFSVCDQGLLDTIRFEKF